jgi:hypothetical protein
VPASGGTGGSADFNTYAGGGGGGYFGGGAGGGAASESASLARGGSGGGGGGSSYTGGAAPSPAPVVVDTGNSGTVNNGNGEAVLTWTDAALHITHIAAGANKYRQAAAGATFTDDDPSGNLSQYTGSINWGDNTTTAIPANHFFNVPKWAGGGFAAGDFHRYATTGTYTVTITINDLGGASATASTRLVVPSGGR